MDELKRIAEILRPLWPGIVVVAKPEEWRLDGKNGRVKVSVLVTDPGCGESWSLVLLDHHPLHKIFWRDPQEAAGLLAQQQTFVRGMAAGLNSALGLEVSDGR